MEVFHAGFMILQSVLITVIYIMVYKFIKACSINPLTPNDL
jgi:hypothetical protein